MKLANRTALVTGAGSGIGRAIALTLHRAGARVFVNDVRARPAEETASLMGVGAERVLIADVSNSVEVRSMFEALDRVDVLVNNAGIAEPPERWEELNRKKEARLDERPIRTHWDVTVEMSDEAWRLMIAVHLDGTFYCIREALKHMNAQGSGSIINLSSTAALTGIPDAPHYGAAKAGVLGLTRSVALEVAARGIRVNAIAPGYTDTPMSANVSPRIREASERSIPLGRWATTDEIAAVALFLASDDAAYVTGQCISPNGGIV